MPFCSVRHVYSKRLQNHRDPVISNRNHESIAPGCSILVRTYLIRIFGSVCVYDSRCILSCSLLHSSLFCKIRLDAQDPCRTIFGPSISATNCLVRMLCGAVEGLACGVDSVISSSTTTHFTGAKIASQWEKEHVQALGRARSKPGRSDLPPSRRTLSLSCTDKVCRWILLGLQGALLSRWVAPVLLSSVVVSADPRSTPATMEQALDRAVVERCKAVFANSAALKVLWGSQTIGGCSWAVPTASVCSNQFTRSLSSVEMALQASSEGKRDGSGEVCVDMGLAGRDLEEGQGLNSRICYVAGGAVKSTEELPPTSSVREVEQIVTSDNRKRVKTRHATGLPLPRNMAREKSACASPLAMNWHRITANKQGPKGGGVEVTLGATGLRHGMTTKDQSKAWSRVSRAAQFSAYVRLRLSIPECVGFRISGEVAGNGVVETVHKKKWDYSDCKRSDVPSEYQQALAEFKAHPQFSGWLSLSESKQEWTGPCNVLCMLDPTPGTLWEVWFITNLS